MPVDRSSKAPSPWRADDRYSAERVRQGQIVLRKPWQRILFAAGLAGCMLVPLLVVMTRGH